MNASERRDRFTQTDLAPKGNVFRSHINLRTDRKCMHGRVVDGVGVVVFAKSSVEVKCGTVRAPVAGNCRSDVDCAMTFQRQFHLRLFMWPDVWTISFFLARRLDCSNCRILLFVLLYVFLPLPAFINRLGPSIYRSIYPSSL